MNAWALAFGSAWALSWSVGDSPPPAVVPVAVDSAGPMGGTIGKQPMEHYVDLSDDADESEVAEIAALVVRYFA